MAPKKDTPADGVPKSLLTGFEEKDVKMLAAAFVSSIGPDKYDYYLMSSLTGNTPGSLKKFWPPVKKKAIEAHPSFATFLGNSGTNIASGETKVAAPKAATPKAKAGGRKRKADTEANSENEAKDADSKSATVEKYDSAGDKSETKTEAKKKAPAKRQPKKAKKEVKSGEDEEVKKELKTEEDSADGGDGMVEEEEV